MNNQELELKVKEILSIENFFDMMEAVFAFEKEYKATEFYKKTKARSIYVSSAINQPTICFFATRCVINTPDENSIKSE